MSTLNQLRSCFYGLAFGDALGKSTEFMDVDSIYRQWPPVGPTDLPRPIAQVTDDTQMALAIADAILDAQRFGPLSPTTVEPSIRHHFIRWYNSPDNTRAPGNTCLRACEALETKIPWYEASVKHSKGCGANMRVPPIALIADAAFRTNVSDTASENPPLHTITHSPERAALCQFQAALTHGHATALAASDLTVYALVQLLNGLSPKNLVVNLIDYAQSQRLTYHEEWLGPLWQRPAIESPEDYISRGWDDCLALLDQLHTVCPNYDPRHDPCDYTGEGWIAEEAMATGLLCFLAHLDSPPKMLTRAAATKGDSDSIACLAGAFAGAYNALSVWPKDWFQRIEYADWIDRVCHRLDHLHLS